MRRALARQSLPPLPVAIGWILLLDKQFGLINQWLQLLPFIKQPIFDIYSFWGIIWVHLTNNLGVKVLLLAPAFGGRCNVEERDLIGLFGVVEPRHLHRIPRVDVIDVTDALHHASFVHVEAGNDAL